MQAEKCSSAAEVTFSESERQGFCDLIQDQLVLASLSPVRAKLIKNAGLEVRIEGAFVDERCIETSSGNLPPEKLAQKLAEEKSREVALRFPDAFVIGCDQILEFEGKVLHKPVDMEDAVCRFLKFSGKTHYLHSAVALFKKGQGIWSHVARADMTVRKLDLSYIRGYLSRSAPDVLGSVGAYQIEGEGIQIFEKINGDYFTVAGLPLLPLLAELRKLGVIDG